MSLVRMLAKVAIGVAVAKGVQTMSAGRDDGVSRGPRSGELGGLGGFLGGGRAPAGSPLGGFLSQIAGGGMGAASGAPNPGTGTPYGRASSPGGSAMGAGMRPGADTAQLDPHGVRAGTGAGASAAGAGGLGGLLAQFGGAGGLSSMLGGALSGGARSGSGASGGIGGLLSQLGGGRSVDGTAGGASAAGAETGGLGALLNQSLQGGGIEPEQPPTPEQEDAAGVMLAAMIQAAKADGDVDEDEQSRILDQLGDVSPDEEAFVRAEMDRPVDARALAERVPAGLEEQVYLMSAMAIDVDTDEERRYMEELQGALKLSAEQLRRVEEMLGR